MGGFLEIKIELEEIFMARKGKSVYERIAETEENIVRLEEELVAAKAHLAELDVEREELEMRQIWQTIKCKGLTAEEVQKLLAKQKA